MMERLQAALTADLASLGFKPEEVEIASFDDSPDHLTLSFPHSGLVNADGTPKSAFRKLAALRAAYLG